MTASTNPNATSTSPGEQGAWRPLETAPKDGTRVRLLIPYDRELFTEEQCTDSGYWDALAESYGDDLWVTRRGCWRFDGDDGAFDIQPTHWMPLPEPPLSHEINGDDQKQARIS